MHAEAQISSRILPRCGVRRSSRGRFHSWIRAQLALRRSSDWKNWSKAWCVSVLAQRCNPGVICHESDNSFAPSLFASSLNTANNGRYQGEKEKASRCASILHGGIAAIATYVDFRTIWEMVMIAMATRITMAAGLAGAYRFLAIMVVKATTILLEGEVVGSVCMCKEILEQAVEWRRVTAVLLVKEATSFVQVKR